MNEGEPGLQRAAAVFLARSRQASPEPVAAFLARHADLREWLEPMLEGEREGEQEEGRSAAGGESLGPYRLLRELGRGGMGIVYEARHRLDAATPIALKVLAGFHAVQPGRAERFRREAAIEAKLGHPNLVSVRDAGQVGDTLYLAMEFVAGAPLDAVLQELAGRDPATLTGADLARAVANCCYRADGDAGPTVGTAFAATSYIAAIVQVAAQLAGALQHLHGAGVIHRDVKPSNILLCPDGRLVLTDLGLARETANDSLTMTGDFAGTPNYVSPEQAMAKRVAVDHRSDLFSFGSTLYELLTLAKAFPGASLPEVLGRIIGKEPVPAARVHRGLPVDLVAVLGKLLEKDPDRRYADAAALLGDLRAFLSFRPVEAQRVSTVARAVRWVRREPLRAALIGMLAVSLPTIAVGGGYLWARGDEIRAGREQLRAREVDALVDDAFAAVSQEDRHQAFALYERALAIDPGCVEAALGMVVAALPADGAEAALHLVEGRFRDLLPASLQAILRHALQERIGRGDARAEAIALPVPQRPLELFLFANLGIRGGDQGPASSLEAIERAVLGCDHPRLWLHLQWAIEADAAADAASARRCAGNLLANWPDDSLACYFAALALRRADPERAADVVRTALAAHPEAGRLHWADGIVREVRGDREGAIAAMARAVERLPTSPAVHYMLGRMCYDTGDLVRARAEFALAHELAPNWVEVWIGTGLTEHKLGNEAAAVQDLRRAVALDRTHAEALFHLGRMLAKGEDAAEGVRCLRLAAESSRTDANKWHHYASAAFRAGDDAAGAAALRTAVAVDPRNERCHVILASFLDQRGTPAELREALVAWTRALPDSVEAWTSYGRHCVRSDVGAGLQDLFAAGWAANRALQLSKDESGSAWLLLGEAEARAGNDTAARPALERALVAPRALTPAERAHCENLLAPTVRVKPVVGTGR